MKKENEWDNISFISRSKHRKKVLELLEKPKTPTRLSNEIGLHFNTTSRVILELEKKGFVTCLNPNQKLHRFYQITTKGKNLLKKLEDVGDLVG